MVQIEETLGFPISGFLEISNFKLFMEADKLALSSFKIAVLPEDFLNPPDLSAIHPSHCCQKPYHLLQGLPGITVRMKSTLLLSSPQAVMIWSLPLCLPPPPNTLHFTPFHTSSGSPLFQFIPFACSSGISQIYLPASSPTIFQRTLCASLTTLSFPVCIMHFANMVPFPGSHLFLKASLQDTSFVRASLQLPAAPPLIRVSARFSHIRRF